MPRTHRTKDAIPDILDRVSRGESLRGACAANKVDAGYFCELMREDEELAQRYARALLARADHEFEGMRDLEAQVLSGELDPQAYRVAMDTRKWRLARMSPKKYGDRVTQEHTGPGGGPVQMDATITIVRAPGGEE